VDDALAGLAPYPPECSWGLGSSSKDLVSHNLESSSGDSTTWMYVWDPAHQLGTNLRGHSCCWSVSCSDKWKECWLG
jgi:hypothetical protein